MSKLNYSQAGILLRFHARREVNHMDNGTPVSSGYMRKVSDLLPFGGTPHLAIYLSYHTFGQSTDIYMEYVSISYVRKVTGIYRRKVEAYARCIDAVNYSVKILGEVIGSQLEKLLEVSEKCKSVTKITQSQMSFVEASHTSHARIMELFSPRTEVSEVQACELKASSLLEQHTSCYCYIAACLPAAAVEFGRRSINRM